MKDVYDIETKEEAINAYIDRFGGSQNFFSWEQMKTTSLMRL